MKALLEQIMAHGRAAGVTQREVTEIGRDGRTLRLAPDGHELVSFATCGYLGLEQDPRTVAAAVDAVQRYGVSFSASRCFATSPLYTEVDALLEQLFGRPVVLAGSTTLAHGAALPILLEPDDVVLFDAQVHHSVQTALAALGARGPRRQSLRHNDLDALESGLVAALAGGAKRVWYCADGVYSMFGDRCPLPELGALMRRYEALYAYIDDAHGMSWCGTNGAGTVIDAYLPRARTILATSLSKGFGAGGGAIVVPDRATKERIENLGPSLMFSIQVPPPTLGAICANARIHLSDELPALQAEVGDRMRLAHTLLRADPSLAPRLPLADEAPTPIHYVVLGDAPEAVRTTARLLEQGWFVNPVSYPAVPRGKGGVRFTVTRHHTPADVAGLVQAIAAEVALLEAEPAPRAAGLSLSPPAQA